MTTASPLLAIAGLHAGYGAIDVLHDVSLGVGAGEFVCVIGANTAGKSTLLRTISGLVAARGSIRFEGQELVGRPSHGIPGLGIAHVPEGRHVFPEMTVDENVMLGAYAVRSASDMAQRREEVLTMFPRLRERLGQLAGTLSGGEQQMVAIGRALMTRPTLLLLDEPSMGLAPIIVAEIFEIVARLNREEGVSVLVAEQSANLVLDHAHRAVVLESGRVVASGSSAELAASGRLGALYLGADANPSTRH